MLSNVSLIICFAMGFLVWSGYSEAWSESTGGEVDFSQIELKAYLIDIEQLKGLYEPNSPSLKQKRECELIGWRFFLVVEVQNRSDNPVRGKFTVQYEGTRNFRIGEVVHLEANMSRPDFFVWRQGSARFTDKEIPPDLCVAWKELYPLGE